jgi:hypothetical protein
LVFRALRNGKSVRELQTLARKKLRDLINQAAMTLTMRRNPALRAISPSGQLLEHDSEKWKPVFRKNHAQTKS